MPEFRKSSVYLNDSLLYILAQYKNKHKGISKTLTILTTRYNEIMKMERHHVKELISPKEILFICSIVSPWHYGSPSSIPDATYRAVEEAPRAILDAAGLERESMLRKVGRLNVAQQFALIEIIEEEVL